MAGLKFSIDQSQKDTAAEFMSNHQCPIEYTGAIGGKESYTFTMTGIGVAVSVNCGCGKSMNITDYADW